MPYQNLSFSLISTAFLARSQREVENVSYYLRADFVFVCPPENYRLAE